MLSLIEVQAEAALAAGKCGLLLAIGQGDRPNQDVRLTMETDLADKPASATRLQQGHQQAKSASTARGLTPPARLFSFVSSGASG